MIGSVDVKANSWWYKYVIFLFSWQLMEILCDRLQHAQTGWQTDGLMGRWTNRQKNSKTDADWSFPVPRAMDRLVSMDTGLNQHKTMLLLAHTHTRVCVLLKRIYVWSLSVFRRLIKSYVLCQPIKPWALSFYLFLNAHQKHMEASFTQHSTANSQGHIIYCIYFLSILEV